MTLFLIIHIDGLACLCILLSCLQSKDEYRKYITWLFDCIHSIFISVCIFSSVYCLRLIYNGKVDTNDINTDMRRKKRWCDEMRLFSFICIFCGVVLALCCQAKSLVFYSIGLHMQIHITRIYTKPNKYPYSIRCIRIINELI